MAEVVSVCLLSVIVHMHICLCVSVCVWLIDRPPEWALRLNDKAMKGMEKMGKKKVEKGNGISAQIHLSPREKHTHPFNRGIFWPPSCPSFTHTLCSL